jgi:hypothetical protein
VAFFEINWSSPDVVLKNVNQKQLAVTILSFVVGGGRLVHSVH